MTGTLGNTERIGNGWWEKLKGGVKNMTGTLGVTERTGNGWWEELVGVVKNVTKQSRAEEE